MWKISPSIVKGIIQDRVLGLDIVNTALRGRYFIIYSDYSVSAWRLDFLRVLDLVTK